MSGFVPAPSEERAMTATPPPAGRGGIGSADRPNTGDLVRTGAIAGAAAAIATTIVAAIASAADVSLEVEAQAIPVPAFAMWTLIGAALGIVLARLLRERRRFVAVAVALTGLSLVPAIAAPDDAATRVVLVGAHLLAAAIIVTTLSRRLADRGTASARSSA